MCCVVQGTDKLAGVLCRLEQRRCRLEHPCDPRSMGLFRRLVREAPPKIAVENGGPNLKPKMSAESGKKLGVGREDSNTVRGFLAGGDLDELDGEARTY
jgi:hypothetical protein